MSAPQAGSCRLTHLYMDTMVTVEVVGPSPESAVDRAFGWFREVEQRCSRFDPASELRQLCARSGEAVPASPLLIQAVAFALEVARLSDGAFDPTIGHVQEARGFTRNYQTGEEAPSGRSPEGASWRDVRLDSRRGTITLLRPLLLDLGAVAKGLAVDLALKELRDFPGAVVEAGGDLAVQGHNAEGQHWRIGIRHPRRADAVCAVLHLTEGAVCTSGDYERHGHLLDPRAGHPVDSVASCTVIAPSAMLADALGTAASILGPERGIAWLERQGVQALMLTPTLERHITSGFARYASCL